jgi:hypothetical protein
MLHVGFLSFLCTLHWTFRRTSARYFILHALMNTWVVWNVFEDACFTLANPTSTYEINPMVIYHVLCFHIYHSACYQTSVDEKVHHVVNVFVVCPLLLLHPSNIVHFAFFFMCGLPGCVTYTTMGMYKLGYIPRRVEKHISKHVSLWIRAPGVVVTCYLIGLNYVSLAVDLANILALLVLFASLWNGMYFLDAVIISDYKCATASFTNPPKSDGYQKKPCYNIVNRSIENGGG